jgi:hypothetical protein
VKAELWRQFGTPLGRIFRLVRTGGSGRTRIPRKDRRRARAPGCWLAAALLALSASAAAAQFQVFYNPPRGDDERDARAFIDDEGVIQTVTRLLNDEFELRHDLTLFLGDETGPSFDARAGEVRMPYSFVFDIADRFGRVSPSNTGLDIYEVTRDAYLHALMHQISHVLFVMYDLRTSGSMEKAVDAMTILLLLRYYESGGDIVINAAELFVGDGNAAMSRGLDFWTEHQFDRQSYSQALCLVYGSDPQRYSELRAGSQFLQLRDRECVREYQRQVNAWFRVLESFLQRPPPG